MSAIRSSENGRWKERNPRLWRRVGRRETKADSASLYAYQPSKLSTYHRSDRKDNKFGIGQLILFRVLTDSMLSSSTRSLVQSMASCHASRFVFSGVPEIFLCIFQEKASS